MRCDVSQGAHRLELTHESTHTAVPLHATDAHTCAHYHMLNTATVLSTLTMCELAVDSFYFYFASRR